METKMEIRTSDYAFLVEQNGKRIASIHLCQNNYSLVFEGIKEPDKETKEQIASLYEDKKNNIYIVCSSQKNGIYDIGFRYLNGSYQKVAEFDYGFLRVMEGFQSKQQEIEKYIEERIIGTFIVCQ